MRAWRIYRYGGPEVMQFEFAPEPAPRDGEILVRVAAASVNPIDWRQRDGEVKDMFPVLFPRVLGRDCAGVVIESRSPDFKRGDRVLGVNDQKRTGVHAEYGLVPAAQATSIPGNVSDIDAVAIGNSGVTAYSAMVSTGKVEKGQRVLVHAAAGGVGGIAVQLAHAFGAEVFAGCSTRNIDYVQSLGADRVIDYTKEDFAAVAKDCDLVFDLVGGDAHRKSYDCLKPGGLLVWIPAFSGSPCEPPRKDVRVAHAGVRAESSRLQHLMALTASGALKPQVGRVWSFSEAREAYEASKGGHSRGKNILDAR
jgi:NADPH:quinone reductase-like Zn-dependent oxidoreductase